MDVDFSDAMCYLISGKGNNFYARTLFALQTRESTPREGIPMMGIVLEQRALVILYCAAWIAKAEFEDVVATIEHEGLHIVLEHIPRKLALAATFQTQEDKESFRLVTHWAEDFAANCLLFGSNEYMRAHLTEWLMPDQEPFKLRPGLSYEEYVHLLMERDQESKKSGEAKAKKEGGGKQGGKNKGEDGEGAGGDGGDGGEFHNFLQSHAPGGSMEGCIPQLLSHFAWEEMTKNLSDEEKQGLSDGIKQKVMEIIKKAVDEHTKSRGTLPAFLQALINKLLTPPKISWLRVLRERVVNTKRWKWRRSVCRPNRRKVGMVVARPEIDLVAFPGKSKDKTFTLVFCLDTSGSMSARELELALNELEHLRKADNDIEVTVIEADADIGREYNIDNRTPVQWEVTGRGGTSFDPALARARELRPDLCIYGTDGGAPAPEPQNRPACPMVWLLTPGMKAPDPSWGDVLKMQDK